VLQGNVFSLVYSRNLFVLLLLLKLLLLIVVFYTGGLHVMVVATCLLAVAEDTAQDQQPQLMIVSEMIPFSSYF